MMLICKTPLNCDFSKPGDFPRFNFLPSKKSEEKRTVCIKCSLRNKLFPENSFQFKIISSNYHEVENNYSLLKSTKRNILVKM